MINSMPRILKYSDVRGELWFSNHMHETFMEPGMVVRKPNDVPRCYSPNLILIPATDQDSGANYVFVYRIRFRTNGNQVIWELIEGWKEFVDARQLGIGAEVRFKWATDYRILVKVVPAAHAPPPPPQPLFPVATEGARAGKCDLKISNLKLKAAGGLIMLKESTSTGGSKGVYCQPQLPSIIKEDLYEPLQRALAEAEIARQEAFAESDRRHTAEKEVMEAILDCAAHGSVSICNNDLQVKISGSLSSQYLTALLMATPKSLGNVELETIDKLISVPYVYKSPGKAYVDQSDAIASSASYFLAGAAVTCGTGTGTGTVTVTVIVEGCGTSSLQLGANVEEGPLFDPGGTHKTFL